MIVESFYANYYSLEYFFVVTIITAGFQKLCYIFQVLNAFAIGRLSYFVMIILQKNVSHVIRKL